MGMYHKNHLIGPKSKRYAKRQTSRGMRRAVKRSCTDESITLRGKSKNLYGYDSWLFSLMRDKKRGDDRHEDSLHFRLCNTSSNRQERANRNYIHYTIWKY